MTTRPSRTARLRTPAPLRSAIGLALVAVWSASCASMGASPGPGSAGLGDPYYPNAGNGGYDVQHYDLELDVDVAGGRLAGRATIDAVATASLTTFNLDFTGFDVREVWVDRRPAGIRREGAELVVKPAETLVAGSEFHVLVVYEGVPTRVADAAVSFAPGVGWDQREDSVYVLSQPTGAHGFFPCNDHPSDKATYSLAVAVPEGYTVAANGTPAGSGWRDGKFVWFFSSRDPMATYLVTVAIDRFDMVEEPGPDGIVLRHYYPEGSDPALREPFARTTAILEFFADRFGPYPFESCGGVLSRRTDLGGALETQTLPVYGLQAGVEYVIAHELAHQWFGNDVALERWSDIWLNEGIAEYLAILWVREDLGEEAYLDRLARIDAVVQKHRIGPPLDPGVERLFGAEVYLRGALAAYALHEAVGEADFIAILRSFREAHTGGTANIDDFYAVVQAQSGSEARALLERWLTQPEPPALPSLDGVLQVAVARDDANRDDPVEEADAVEAPDLLPE